MKDRIFEISFKINCRKDKEANLQSMKYLIIDELQWFGKVSDVMVKRIREGKEA